MNNKEQKRLYDIQYRIRNEVRIRRNYKKYYRKNMLKVRTAVKQYRIANLKKVARGDRKKHLWRAYGLRESDYTNMLKDQHGRCAICQQKPKNHRKLDIDHSHTTGEVRGLLCRSCNALLGKVEHSRDALRNLLRYLGVKKWRSLV